MRKSLAQFIIFGILLCRGVVAADLNEINQNIQKNEAQKSNIDKQRANLNLKLSTLGQNINNNMQQIKKLDAEIQNLAKNIENNKDQNKTQEAKLQTLKNNLAVLNESLSQSQTKLSNLILQHMTIAYVLDDEESLNLEDMVTREAFKILKKQTTNEITQIEKQQRNILRQINDINRSIKEVTQIITTQETKHQDLQTMIGKQKILVDNMRNEMQVYNQRLKAIEMQKKELDKLLGQLNILKKNTQEEIRKKQEAERLAKLERERLAKLERERKRKIEEEKKKAALAKAEAEKIAKAEAEKIAKTDSKKAQQFLGEQNQAIQRKYDAALSSAEASNTINSFEELKRVDSVYQRPETARYTGKRAGAPLDSYIIEQAFGDYIDPAYKIKIFNNGVVLKSRKNDVQVYNIMDGKVIYAEEMPGLKKVVVVEHANSMHTIYSMIDKIAPTLKKGFIVKKGYVIGRINEKLNLEIVQNGKHINPVEVMAKN
ncbi:murein hydrolase activator EnvC [Helicobacter trogontum]|uniref:M23 family metallopeptidase n=1 Tax=Helicobacter trogontum TaxID=50960 RepID=A0A4U8TE24_9HELI|nr:M23 family metallopeptidase [Helicobacter trogontum]MCI5786312.1 peptidoglycan DD-metalloendopeptidase family protein [Helicobacter trogontum]MDY5186195.1 peptidoglycan DD-metalloendopeptidase family protein [Helicobacter trogontum]TLD98265.1 hypothetical protein LS80_005475 [Helicobacter trogontum]